MQNLDEKEKFDDNHISTETFHDICDGNQTRLNIDKMVERLKYVIVLRKINFNGMER